MARVVLLPHNTADLLWCWIAGPGEVCVRGHDKQTDVSVRCVVWPTRNQRHAKVEGYIVKVNHSHPLSAIAELCPLGELVHVHRGEPTVNVGGLVTGSEVEVITDDICKLVSKRVFIVVVRPWGVHEPQSISDDVSVLLARNRNGNIM